MSKEGIQEILRADLVLTTAYVASTSMNVADKDNVSLYASYTNEGAANNIQYYAEFSADNSTWYRDTHTEVDGTAATGICKAQVDTFVAIASVSAADNLKIPFKCPDNYIRFMVKETVAAGSAGNLELKAVANRNSFEDLGKNVI